MMTFIGEIIIIIFFILLIKGLSSLFDSPSQQPSKPGSTPDNYSDTRNFQWVLQDSIQQHLLSCEVKLNISNAENAKDDLLNEYSQPSKLYFTSDSDYFNIAQVQVLHESFGIGSKEIEQIANYLEDYADKQMMSNYQLANLILSFVHEQNIKYSYDEDSTGHIEYMRYPIETIFDTTGDCDCKAVLASTLFKKLGYSVAFALMPGHAALAVTSESAPFYSNLVFHGKNWFYCESTGDNWKPGELPNSFSQLDIRLKEL